MQILGIILVSAILILPASMGRLVSKSFKGFFVSSIIISEVVVLGGLFLSYYIDKSGSIENLVFLNHDVGKTVE